MMNINNDYCLPGQGLARVESGRIIYQKPELMILLARDEILGGAETLIESQSGYYQS